MGTEAETRGGITMENRPEFSLDYLFDFRKSKDLKAGDYLASSVPTDTTLNGQSVIISPAGFPIPLSLHLLHRKILIENEEYCGGARGRGLNMRTMDLFLLQLRLHLPTHVPFIPSLLIQPTCLLTNREGGAHRLDRRLLGLQQPAVWEFMLSVAPFEWVWKDGGSGAGRQQLVSVSIPIEVEGQFRFQLLDEPETLIANLPPISTADWACLPMDMVSAVLRELPLADKVNARLVCHSWACVLDSDSRIWNNVTFLETFDFDSDLEGPYDYHMGRRNQVRDSRLLEALEFLITRGAPIRTLELSQELSVLLGVLKDLPSTLSRLDVFLKTLAARSQYSCNFGGVAVEHKTALVDLIKSQPSLERMYLDVGLYGVSPSLLPAMPRLRILSLRVCGTEPLDELRNQVQLLQGLDGLALSHHDVFTCDGGGNNLSDISSFSSTLQLLGLNLRPVAGVGWKQVELEAWPYQETLCVCGDSGFHSNVMAWGTGALSPVEAALLLHPVHHQPLSHYRL